MICNLGLCYAENSAVGSISNHHSSNSAVHRLCARLIAGGIVMIADQEHSSRVFVIATRKLVLEELRDVVDQSNYAASAVDVVDVILGCVQRRR